MFIYLNFFLLFICLFFNLIKFDEEFLVMCTIIISFSQILKIAFQNINENYIIFKKNIKNIYIYLINMYIKNIINLYFFFYNIQTIFINLNNIYFLFKINILKMIFKLYHYKIYLIYLINILLLEDLLKIFYFIKTYKNNLNIKIWLYYTNK